MTPSVTQAARILRDRFWPRSQIRDAQTLAARISRDQSYTPQR